MKRMNWLFAAGLVFFTLCFLTGSATAQEITIALEQDAAFTKGKTYFLDERQTRLHLIR